MWIFSDWCLSASCLALFSLCHVPSALICLDSLMDCEVFRHRVGRLSNRQGLECATAKSLATSSGLQSLGCVGKKWYPQPPRTLLPPGHVSGC